MRRLCFLIYLLSLFTFAQNPSLVKSLDIQCDTLKNSGDYKKLIATAEKGIQLTSDTYYASRFYFFKAYGLEYDNNRYVEAVPLFEKSLALAQKGKHLKEETLALMRLNYLYFSTKKFKQRDSLIAYVKRVLDTTKNIYTQGILNGTLGEYYLDNSEFEKFIGYKLKAINYRKKFPKDDKKNTINIGISYSQIGQAYYKMKLYNKAVEYQNYAKPYLVKSANATANLYNDFIKCYYRLNKIDSLSHYYKKIDPLVSTNDSLYISRSLANRYMAEYWLDKKQSEKAAFYVSKAQSFAEKSNDDAVIMEAQLSKGKLLFLQKKYQEAITTLTNASTYAFEFDKESYLVITNYLAECFAATGDWKKAYTYQKEFNRVNENLLRESAKQSIANAEAQFQNRNKQQRINALSTENQLKNLQIKNSQRQKLFLLLGFLFLVIVAALLYNQNQNRRKTNEKLQQLNDELEQANKTKTRFFSILNHDLRSPVSSLVNFLNLQKNNPELLDTETRNRLENLTYTGAENLLHSMEDLLLWSKGQMENFKPVEKPTYITPIFEEIKAHFVTFDTIEFEFLNPENLSLITDENYLKTIMRNLTGNAIKALQNAVIPSAVEGKTIRWRAWQENNHTYLAITDNGPGATEEDFRALYDANEVVGIKTGLGLHLIRDLAKSINATIRVDSEPGNGTTITLEFQ